MSWWRRRRDRKSLRRRPTTAAGSCSTSRASGLDVRRDRLLAIAAVACSSTATASPRIALGDSFEACCARTRRVRPTRPTSCCTASGSGAQRDGVPPAEALGAFERWLADAPLVAFHAAFDEAMIERGDAGRPSAAAAPAAGSTSSRWPARCIPRFAAARWTTGWRTSASGARPPPGRGRHAGHGRTAAAPVARGAGAALRQLLGPSPPRRGPALARAGVGRGQRCAAPCRRLRQSARFRKGSP